MAQRGDPNREWRLGAVDPKSIVAMLLLMPTAAEGFIDD